MALKKENQEVTYSDRIGVNRGAGFDFGARVFQQQANAIDNLTAQFADTALTSIQKAGKKLGTEAAENAKFSKKEIQYIDADGNEKTQFIDAPIPELKGPVTKSMQEAYDKEIYTKYKNEVQSTVRNIIVEERANAIEAKGNPEDFNQIVESRIAPIINSLDPKFATVINTYAEEQRQSHWYQVWDEHNRHLEQIDNISYDEGTKLLTGEISSLLVNNADPKIVNEKIEELKEHVGIYADKKNEKAIATGQNVIKNITDGKEIYQTIASVNVKDLSIAKPSEVKQSIEDLRLLDSVLSGASQKVTLSNGVIVTQDGMRSATNNNQGAIDAAKIRVNAMITDLSGFYELNKKSGTMISLAENNYMYGEHGRVSVNGGQSDSTWREWLNSEEGFDYLAGKYNATNPEKPITDINDPRYTKLAIRSQGHLPLAVYEKMENAFETMNMNDIQDLYTSGIIPYLTNFKMSFEMNGIESTLQVNALERAGFPTSIINKINMIDSEVQLTGNFALAMDNVKKFYDKYPDGINKTSVSAYIMEASKGKKTITDVNKVILSKTEDLLDDSAMGSTQLGDVNFPVSLYNQVKTKVYEYITDGTIEISKDSQIEKIVETSLAAVLSGKTNHGFSKYGINDFAPQGLEYKADRENFVFNAPETHYSLPNGKGVSWMNDDVMKLVKGSLEYDAGYKNIKDLAFGKQIKLRSVDTSVPPRYEVVFVNNDGLIDVLQDQNGMNIIYDPSKKFQELFETEITSDETNAKINDLKEKRKDNLMTLQELEDAGYIKNGVLQW